MPGHADTSGVALDLEPGPADNGRLLAGAASQDGVGDEGGAASQDGVGDEGADASLEGIPMKDRSVVAPGLPTAQEGRKAPTQRDLTLELWKVCSLCVKQSLESPKQLCSCTASV